MFSTQISRSWRRFVYCLAVTIVAATVVALIDRDLTSAKVFAQDGSTVESPSTVFPGTGVGPIPDQGAFTVCQANLAADLVISFAVSGITAPLTDVRVTMQGNHTWAGDLRATLVAPGGSPSQVLFWNRGDTTGTTCGSSNAFAGPYVFFDGAQTATSFFNVAGSPVPANNYRTTGALSPTATSMLPVFSGLSTAQVNGTWTLRVKDVSGTDTGSITSASLEVVGTAGSPTPTPPDALADFDGDGKTDYAVIRTAPGINGQATWYVNVNATAATITSNWGFASDWYVPGDFDGDGKDDFAVWRPGIQGTFYIIESSTNSLRARDFGITGDDASVVGDYNNDGKDDIAVYRSGLAPGSQSFWFWEFGGTIYGAQWGLNGDFVAPGDYDGDGIMDPAVQRNNGANSDYYVRYSSGVPPTVTTFGLANDVVVPGDYDGDLRTDLAVVRPVGANLLWVYRKSSNGTDVSANWGLTATDIPAPGDYNGDGRADYAVWRPGALSTFYVMTPETLLITTRQWGLNDDVPATLNYTH